MSIQQELDALLAEHQTREVELRRLQNCQVVMAPEGFVGVIDTQWFEVSDNPEHASIGRGVIPVSSKYRSNWHLGGETPFVTDPELNPRIKALGNQMHYPWLVFSAQVDSGVLLITPDGERIIANWGHVKTTECGGISICAFKDEQAARNWVNQFMAYVLQP